MTAMTVMKVKIMMKMRRKRRVHAHAHVIKLLKRGEAVTGLREDFSVGVTTR
jgi:hypothetical protein